jgi:hypothetical protein
MRLFRAYTGRRSAECSGVGCTGTGQDAVKVSCTGRRYLQSSNGVIEHATIFRSKEQVLFDLSKALHFSPESLEENRKGRLSTEQAKRLAAGCARPAILTFIFALAPFAVWTWITAGRQQISFPAAFPVLITQLTHVNDLFEAQGKIGGGIMLGSILIGLVLALLMSMRVSVRLYFDLIDRKVTVREGRVVAREEQVNRPNGRDPIEKYFFSLRYLTMPVNLAAYRALEAGSIYLVYLLPRSELLVSIEPKMDDATLTVGSPEKPSHA